MQTFGILELQDRLPEYEKRAAGGERILVTNQNKIVAELTPPAATPQPAADAVLADLIRQGLATPPRIATVQLPKARGRMKLADIREDLVVDRGDR